MDRFNELPPQKQTPKQPPRIIEYADLVDLVQLSVARLHDIPGALDATSFAELTAPMTRQEYEQTEQDVGRDFDQALINFVTVALIANRHQDLIILAEASEGIDGALPWQPELEAQLQQRTRVEAIGAATVRIERYTAAEKTVAATSDQPAEYVA